MKILFLTLIAGLYSVSNGALILECTPELEAMVPPGEYELFVLSSEPSVNSLWIVLVANGAFDLLAVSYPDGYDLILFNDWGDNVYAWELDWTGMPYTPPAGQLLEMLFLFPEVVSDFEIYLLDESTTIVDSRQFVVAPEPFTISFLGLGALLIRKRRK